MGEILTMITAIDSNLKEQPKQCQRLATPTRTLLSSQNFAHKIHLVFTPVTLLRNRTISSLALKCDAISVFVI